MYHQVKFAIKLRPIEHIDDYEDKILDFNGFKDFLIRYHEVKNSSMLEYVFGSLVAAEKLNL